MVNVTSLMLWAQTEMDDATRHETCRLLYRLFRCWSLTDFQRVPEFPKFMGVLMEFTVGLLKVRGVCVGRGRASRRGVRAATWLRC